MLWLQRRLLLHGGERMRLQELAPGLVLTLLCACVTDPGPIAPDPYGRGTVTAAVVEGPAKAPAQGSEIVLHGARFDIGAAVVLWTDPGGYNAYATAILPGTDPTYASAAGERYRAGRNEILDQFVLHYDVCGTSRKCFDILHNLRGLSVHFLLDIDGTLYQTMDLADTAWHATRSNDRSIGVEIAHIGARSPDKLQQLNEWYTPGRAGMRLTIPARYGDGGVRTQHFEGHAARPRLIEGRINGGRLLQYDFTDEQYDTLSRLLAVLTREVPALPLRFPRNADGSVRSNVLADSEFAAFKGILGHYHVQKNKTDPGPAFDWARLEREIRSLR